ncbi:alpha/beta fold hydrolase [Paraglaciecola marina]|uniref:alpha/beta fold hydrolase n=1 Tax=Paraglaciecola marina TaxID=2500157 RepID=UPI00105C7D4D|nr:alpha/beta hydrolase [Paraglaciecola marina]
MKTLSFKNYKLHANYSELCGHKIAHWQSVDFETAVDKEVIVLIHGFPSAAWDWHLIWKHLAKRYRLVSLDMLGFGLSDKPSEHQYSLIEQADIVEALLKEKVVTNYHILAHDYGDSVAQELLYRHEQSTSNNTIASICFLNGGLFSAVHRPLFSQKLLQSRYGKLACQFLNKNSLSNSFNKIFGANTQASQTTIDTLWKLLKHNKGKVVLPKLITYIDERKVFGKTWIESMITTSIPMYFINGVLDPISGQQMLDHYVEIIPNPLTTALEVGHYPQLEAPEQVLDLYFEFLAQTNT